MSLKTEVLPCGHGCVLRGCLWTQSWLDVRGLALPSAAPGRALLATAGSGQMPASRGLATQVSPVRALCPEPLVAPLHSSHFPLRGRGPGAYRADLACLLNGRESHGHASREGGSGRTHVHLQSS